jgi:hypothetical protein
MSIALALSILRQKKEAALKRNGISHFYSFN